jgi:hypothetical protein
MFKNDLDEILAPKYCRRFNDWATGCKVEEPQFDSRQGQFSLLQSPQTGSGATQPHVEEVKWGFIFRR